MQTATHDRATESARVKTPRTGKSVEMEGALVVTRGWREGAWR